MLLKKIFINYHRSVIITSLIIILSFMPTNNLSGGDLFNIPHLDKIAHLLFYLLLTFTILYDLNQNIQLFKTSILLIVLICIALFGGIIEVIQVFLPNRSGDIIDLLFNIGGNIAALILFLIVRNFFPSILKNNVFK